MKRYEEEVLEKYSLVNMFNANMVGK